MQGDGEAGRLLFEEPGRFLLREVLKFFQIAYTSRWRGMEIVECSPSYHAAEITSLMATRVDLLRPGLPGAIRQPAQQEEAMMHSGFASCKLT